MPTPKSPAALALFTLAIAAAGSHCTPAAKAPPPPASPASSTVLVPGAPIPEPAPIVRRASASPMSLTASDGTGLRLVAIEGQSVLADPLAFTELRLVFQNPVARAIEGRFSITLPPGASVSRFAMRVGADWQEAEVVEKRAARVAYEDFLHRKQDPALLEQGAGNEFSARVFPIPAGATKELLISYSQEVVSSAPSLVALEGLPEVDRVDLSLGVAGTDGPTAALHREHFVAAGDFGFDPRTLRQGGALRSGDLVVVRVQPAADAPGDPLASVVVLFDTSASRALGFSEQVDLLDRLVRGVAATAGPSTVVSIGAFDQTTEPLYEGPAGSFGPAALAKARERAALGASDLGQALAWARGRAASIGAKRVVLISDGVATAGDTDSLAAAAAKLGEGGVERLDAVAVGGLRDDAMLRRLVNAGLAHGGVVADGSEAFSVVQARLGHATRSGLAVQVDGASWSWPLRLDGVQAGDEAIVYAELAPDRPVSITVGGAKLPTPSIALAERPLVERSWAKAKIESLLDHEARAGKTDASAQQIVALSTTHRVLTPYTSFLVLESEGDYDRFHIDRRAVSDLLTIAGGKLVTRRRSDAVLVVAPQATAAAPAQADSRPPPPGSAPPGPPPAGASPSPPPSRPDANERAQKSEAAAQPSAAGGLAGVGEGGGGAGEGIGLGSIGTIGHGAGSGTGQGFGSGQGRLGGEHRTSPPQIRQGATSVSGRIPPEVIQRIVRQNYGRFRLCYENGLRSSPNLQGRVSVRFIIGTDGSVSSAANAGSDLPNPAVVSCIVRGFGNLSFPQPEGGIVTVVYPMTFSPGEPSRDGMRYAGPPLRPGSSWQPPERPEPPQRPAEAHPYDGTFKLVMDAIAGKDAKTAGEVARKWHEQAPGDVMALVAVGEAAEASGDAARAARAYGSIIDLFSSRADLRRFAGEHLERLAGEAALALAVDTYDKAKRDRPDHPSSHRLLAFALLKKGEHEKAFTTIASGMKAAWPRGRFPGVDRIFADDLGLIAAAWIKAEPKLEAQILGRLKEAGATLDTSPSLRFVLDWETDANDVDFHIYDDAGDHAFYGHKTLRNGGELYADVTQGYGPECFTIRKPKAARAAAYTLQANYFSRGPMGYGMGKLEVIDHDGKGGLTFEEHPYAVMIDHAFVNLGTIKR